MQLIPLCTVCKDQLSIKIETLLFYNTTRIQKTIYINVIHNFPDDKVKNLPLYLYANIHIGRNT